MNMYQIVPSVSLPVFHGVSSSRALSPSLDVLSWDRKQTVKRATRPAGNGTAKQARPPRGGPR